MGKIFETPQCKRHQCNTLYKVLHGGAGRVLAGVIIAAALGGLVSVHSAWETEVVSGNIHIRNDDHTLDPQVRNQMDKTLTRDDTTGEWALELTIGGFVQTKAAEQTPLYTVLVLDATSSMGGYDNDATKGPPEAQRWPNVAAAAKAYIETLITGANDREINIAVVSFGYGARVHTYGKGFGSAVGDRTKKTPAGLTVEGLDDKYIGGWRGKEEENLYAEGGATAFGEYNTQKGKDAEDTSVFFYDKDARATLEHIIDNISQYSGTNVESGLLLAEDLLNHIPKPEEKERSIVLMTDGESAATSTFAQLFRDPLVGVNLSNVYVKSMNDDNIRELYTTAEANSNPFDGNWHNADVNSSIVPRIIPFDTNTGMLNMAKTIAADNEYNPEEDDNDNSYSLDDLTQLNNVGDAQDFLEYVHTMLEYLGAYDNDSGKYIESGDEVQEAQADFWNDAVKSLFWQGEYLTYDTDNKDDPFRTKLIQVFSSKISVPEDKSPFTAILDYKERGSATPWGSDSVRYLTGLTAEKIKASGIEIYMMGVGKDIHYPAELRAMASTDSPSGSSPHFYIAYHNADTENSDPTYIGITMAAQKLEEMALSELGVRVEPARNVTIRDTLEIGFTVDTANLANKAKITRWYYEVGEYDEDDNLKLSSETADYTAESENFTVLPNNGHIEINVGTIWDIETAKLIASKNGEWLDANGEEIKLGTKLYVKAAVEFPVLVDTNTNVIARNTWVPSNTKADFTYSIGGKDVEPKILYISPEIYIPYYPPPIDTPPASESPEPSETPDEPGDEDEGDDDDNDDGGEDEDPGEPQEPEEPEPAPGPEEPEPEPPVAPPGVIIRPGTPDTPPEPAVPGGTLTPQIGDDGEEFFIEVDEDGVPLGEWHYIPPEEVWIYEPYPPLGEFTPPQTGDGGAAVFALMSAASAAGLIFAATPRKRRE
jgi:hypothetical protein